MSIQTKVLVAFMFLLSGATSLILETVWIRVLSLGTGATSTAIGMVLAIFFLGLAIGSYLAGTYAHKIRRPILWYGLLEGAVGLYAFVLIHILLNFHNLIQFAPHAGEFAWVGSLVKFSWVTILLLPASIGMGASLPILVRLFLNDDARIGRLISFLYGLNTLGAVLGALLAGFIFIPNLGVLDSSYLASVINIVIAIMGVA